MSFIVAFLGLPASGKTLYGKKIAEKFKWKFFPEIATQVIMEDGYMSAGFKLPYEFDEKVFELNRRRIEETQKILSKTPVVWESHMFTDATYLMGRAFFGDNNPKRFKLLQKYQTQLINQLKDRTIFVILDMDPEVSLKRQRERGKPELMTPDVKLLNYVRKSFLKFYKDNKKRCILVKVDDKSPDEVLREIEEKLMEKIKEMEEKLQNN